MVIEFQMEGKVVIVVDEVDSDLLSLNWSYRKGYLGRNIKIDGKPCLCLLHRMIMERIAGRPLLQDELVDHWDRDTLNNTRKNLRIATRSQNQQNRKVNSNSTSGYKGVSYAKLRGQWLARINIHGRQKSLGYFDTAEMAAFIYNQSALKHFGEFANLNELPEGFMPLEIAPRKIGRPKRVLSTK